MSEQEQPIQSEPETTEAAATPTTTEAAATSATTEAAATPATPVTTEAAATTATSDRRRVWYVLHTYSGYEVKVKKSLEQRIAERAERQMQNEIFQVVVPTEEEVEIKDGHRRTVERRVFPGYVLVEMLEFKDNDERSDEAWYLIRQTNGVTSFVGEGATEPTPLSSSDVEKIMGRMHAAQPKVKINFKVGHSVRITDGPFADFVGMVDELMVDKGKVRVLVNFFGRETPVELDFIQVEKQ